MKDGQDVLYGQQDQAMMSTAERNALSTHKECLYLHQSPQQRKMPELKGHIYNSM